MIRTLRPLFTVHVLLAAMGFGFLLVALLINLFAFQAQLSVLSYPLDLGLTSQLYGLSFLTLSFLPFKQTLKCKLLGPVLLVLSVCMIVMIA